jgi:hypothetical protein
VSFALPESRKKIASAESPWEKKTCPGFTWTILCVTPAACKKRAGSNKVLFVPGIGFSNRSSPLDDENGARGLQPSVSEFEAKNATISTIVTRQASV